MDTTRTSPLDINISRRNLLYSAGVGLAFMSLPTLSFAESDVQPSIPILMFHKVDDKPRYPEDITSAQLELLFAYLWKEGFRPVNISDILGNRVDNVVPKGYKPIGITADDSHRSIYFSAKDIKHDEQRNERSFINIFIESMRSIKHTPRGTFFLSAVGDNRYSKEPEGYFGEYMPLGKIIESLNDMAGIEFGYHTRTHKIMGKMEARQVRELIEDQMRDFERLKVLDKVVRILAYPYGVRPPDEGLHVLRDLGFIGAVLAFPGEYEDTYEALQQCNYDGRLITDPFLIPRVCIGSHIYARRVPGEKGGYALIDPIDDFKKDVENAFGKMYVSRG